MVKMPSSQPRKWSSSAPPQSSCLALVVAAVLAAAHAPSRAGAVLDVRTTACAPLWDQPLQMFDQFDAYCGTSSSDVTTPKAISGWKILDGASTGGFAACDAGDYRLETSCLTGVPGFAATGASCSTHVTAAQMEFWGKDLLFLDRHIVTCADSGKALSRWQVVASSDTSAGSWIAYTCCPATYADSSCVTSYTACTQSMGGSIPNAANLKWHDPDCGDDKVMKGWQVVTSGCPVAGYYKVGYTCCSVTYSPPPSPPSPPPPSACACLADMGYNA